MRKNIFNRFLINPFWLSIILHLLILLCFIFFLSTQEEKRKKPNLFVPSYVYHASVAPTIQQRSSAKSVQSNTKKENQTPQLKKFSDVKNAIQAPLTARSLLMREAEKKNTHVSQSRPKSMMAATATFLKESMHHSISAQKDEEPIYLIGDNNLVSDPLIILLGKALSAHFEYPRLAGEMGIRGRVLIKLTLHPEGYISNVQMLESSHSQDLDAAALYAVNSAPTVYGADRFIHSPKNFVIGFIFRVTR